VPVIERMTAVPVGTGELRRRGRTIALLAFGSTLGPALEAADALDATVANMRFVKPLDAALVLELAATHAVLVTLEENVIAGGAGSAVNECLALHGMQVTVLNLGMPDRFLEHGTREEMLAEAGLDSAGILRRLAPYRRTAHSLRIAQLAASAGSAA